MKNKFKLAGLLFLGLVLFATCKKETPLPTADFTYSATGNVVTFYATVSNDSKYEWDFGDGSYINTIHSPSHAYANYGQDYMVKLTIIGPGGQTTVTNKVTTPTMTKMQLLTGGIAGSTSSKKWRINKGAAFFDVTLADANFTSQIPSSYQFGGVLSSVNLQKAYLDEYVFKANGTMTINSVGGGIFASLAYCMGNGIAMSSNYAALGMAYTAAFTPPTAATFAINEGKDLVVGTPVGNVTYAKVMTLSFGNGGFFGLKDFTTECIIKKITDNEINAILFYAHPQYGAKPMLALNVTFETIK